MIFNQNKLYKNVIGVIFGGKFLHVARLENGRITEIVNREINNRESKEVILNDIINTIKKVHNDTVTGIGVGMPSLVDIREGVVFKPTNIPSWNKVHLKDILEEKFNVPIFINNDANCFALGEKYFGVAKDFDDIAGITIGTGMGVGIIINGKLYSGRNAGAGEFCSIPYKDHDYEYYCSTKYFEEKYGLKYNVLLNRAQKKDKIALAIFEIFGNDLGNAIKTIMFALDPEAIVIGGRLADAYEFFKESMFKTVNTFIYKTTLKNIKILRSTESNISIYGAAALCFEE
ncbi:MAG TPA: ROK family protein [Fermentimonas caenicola]|jgi:glucokinase|uniref:ROK family protein n=1 Tax=Lascolabacillus TaxID=1924067 RepID=UPI00093A37A8|nr:MULTISPECIES: ROK family protein [Lascolabacillus]MBP6176154.1 ROK family protein [Fermentimonas sp.]MDI9624846.1 ROK family protein [Bacteroidota bacterium]TAH60509.1 MAG: ROK family protein [Fermentimonas caenicola]MBP7105232.1 ROK family protein [Fermentimonas sp.]MCK9501298.1 ROK family protein [Lascolabacillus sp.]